MFIKFWFGFKKAGLISFEINYVAFHFIVPMRHWFWGRSTEEYDALLEYFGLGPLFLIAWMPTNYLRTFWAALTTTYKLPRD